MQNISVNPIIITAKKLGLYTFSIINCKLTYTAQIIILEKNKYRTIKLYISSIEYENLR